MRLPEQVIERRRVVRDVLRGRFIAFPVQVFGLLGGDPNKMDLESQIALTLDLLALGYKERKRKLFPHAHLMTAYVREDTWPGESFGTMPPPYVGIPLKQDPDFREELREMRAKKKAFFARLKALYGEQ